MGELGDFSHLSFGMNNKKGSKRKRALDIDKGGKDNSGAC
jgi:hypothetical protein